MSLGPSHTAFVPHAYECMAVVCVEPPPSSSSPSSSAKFESHASHSVVSGLVVCDNAMWVEVFSSVEKEDSLSAFSKARAQASAEGFDGFSASRSNEGAWGPDGG